MTYLRFILAAVLAVPCLGAELPVSRVTLYKHGVGFFERAGEIPAGESAVLRFQASEMDDVLKSLTLEQRGGEGVAAVRYDSSDPLAKRLEVFPFQIGEAVSLVRILDQFKGAEIELAMSGGPLRGVVVSARETPATRDEPERQALILFAGGAMRMADPAAASEIRFTDPAIQRQFQDYLAILARSRNTDRRAMTIESQGGASSIAASYVAPSPAWKSSYRLILGSGQTALFEGWAIVDNTSGDDWENVRLTLVSGLPVSFVTKLYEPVYVERPSAELAQDRVRRPRVHGGAVDEAAADASAEARGGVLGGILAGAPAAEMMRMEEPPFARKQASSTVASTAEAADLGELFEYSITRPVTIGKSESAMLPFFREDVAARRLYFYDGQEGSQHPLAAVEIRNENGPALDGGAVTVYDGNAYAGEALFETIKAGDKRLISYSVDLGTRITTAFDSTSKLESKFRASRGVVTIQRWRTETATYTVRNVDPRAKTLVIERPARPGYNVVRPQPVEKTANANRFEFPLEANFTGRFAVVEQRPEEQSFGLTNATHDQIMVWVRNQELDAAGRRKLEEIATLKRRIAELQSQEQRAAERIRELNEDQGRLRNNIATLRQVSGQQEKVMEYSEQLAAQETELAGLRRRQSDLRRQADDLQRQLNEAIETLEI